MVAGGCATRAGAGAVPMANAGPGGAAAAAGGTRAARTAAARASAAMPSSIAFRTSAQFFAHAPLRHLTCGLFASIWKWRRSIWWCAGERRHQDVAWLRAHHPTNLGTRVLPTFCHGRQGWRARCFAPASDKNPQCTCACSTPSSPPRLVAQACREHGHSTGAAHRTVRRDQQGEKEHREGARSNTARSKAARSQRTTSQPKVVAESCIQTVQQPHVQVGATINTHTCRHHGDIWATWPCHGVRRSRATGESVHVCKRFRPLLSCRPGNAP